MKINQHSTTALFFTAITAAASLGFTVAEFQEIAGVPQNVQSVDTMVECVGKTNPLTMWTIEVADTVTVSTSPPDLVTVGVEDGELSFAWNADVSSKASSIGIKIGIPADQLQSLKVYSYSSVQISGSFSSVSNLEVYGNSIVNADLSSNVVPINVNVYGDSMVSLKSGSNLENGSVYGGSKLTVATPSFDNNQVYGNSVVFVDGNMNSGSAYGKGKLTVTGDLSGAISLYGGSTMNAASCSDNISSYGGGKCVSGTQTVDVSIETQPMTRTGTSKCWVNPLKSLFGSGSSSVYSCRASVTAIAMGAAYMVV